jgi:hypothetical protein
LCMATELHYGVKGMRMMSHTLLQGQRSPRGQCSRGRYIHTTLYDFIDALYDQVAPGEEALVLTTVMEIVQTGRLVFLGTVSEAEV